MRYLFGRGRGIYRRLGGGRPRGAERCREGPVRPDPYGHSNAGHTEDGQLKYPARKGLGRQVITGTRSYRRKLLNRKIPARASDPQCPRRIGDLFCHLSAGIHCASIFLDFAFVLLLALFVSLAGNQMALIHFFQPRSFALGRPSFFLEVLRPAFCRSRSTFLLPVSPDQERNDFNSCGLLSLGDSGSD